MTVQDSPDGDAPVSIGVDIGGTGTRFVALDGTHQVIARTTYRTPSQLDRAGLVDLFRRGVAAVAPERPLRSIGVGASGPVDELAIRNPDTLPAFTDLPLVELVGAALGVGVTLENDAVVAAIAEQRIGSARGSAALLQVTLGTGIGTALILEGRPWRGGDRRHPEGGHMTTAIASQPCYCGRSQCWEQAASRASLQARAAGLLGAAPTDPTAISRVAEHAGDGDCEALRLFEEYGLALADGLGTLLELYRPTDVVLGGSGALPFRHYERSMIEALAPLQAWLPRFEVHTSVLDDFAGAIGAAFLGEGGPDPA